MLPNRPRRNRLTVRLLGRSAADSIRARSLHYMAASFLGAAISFLALPWTTRILGPLNYGQLALAAAVVNSGATLSTLGASFAINNRWLRSSRDEQGALLTGLCVKAAVTSGAWAAAVVALFLVARPHWSALTTVTDAELALTVVATLLAPYWFLASDVATIERRSLLFSAVTFGQAAISTTVTLVSLYVFDLRGASLFVGLAAGSVVSITAAAYVLVPRLGARRPGTAAGDLATGRFLLAQVTDSANALLERGLVSHFSGFVVLGLYTHSQGYGAYVFQAAKAVSRGVWPVTLQEAADRQSTFPRTGRTWRVVHLGVVAVGIPMTLLGDRLISLLTNGKFTGAHVYLAGWFSLILLQNAAKPEGGVVFALGNARIAAMLNVGANLARLLALCVLVPIAGAKGALVAALAQAAVYRVWIRSVARRLRPTPFQDEYVVAGIVLLVVAFALKRYVLHGVWPAAACAVALDIPCAVAAVRLLRRRPS